jgi:hypothetical protein
MYNQGGNYKMDKSSACAASMPADIQAKESERIRRRREQILGLKQAAPAPADTVGLALSGGGIRSATFSLGVLQALAKHGLLKKIDYLSTVSGGGYIGCFFGGLFVPQALREARKPEETRAVKTEEFTTAANEAYATLEDSACGPPQLDRETTWSPRTPLRWLRENGRYMAPTGAGDFLYDITLALRNWLSIHYVLGITCIATFLALIALRIPLFSGLEEAFRPGSGAVWMSPWWAVPPLIIAFLLAPLGLSYWLTQIAPPDQSRDLTRWIAILTAFIVLGSSLYGIHELLGPAAIDVLVQHWKLPVLAIGVTAVTLPILNSLLARLCPESWRQYCTQKDYGGLVAYLISMGVITGTLAFLAWQLIGSQALNELGDYNKVCVALLALATSSCVGGLYAYLLAYLKRWRTPARSRTLSIRTLLTRRLVPFMTLTLIFTGIATIDTLAQTLYFWLLSPEHRTTMLSGGGVVGVIIWLARKLLTTSGDKEMPGWLSHVPLDLLALAVGAALVAVFGALWGAGAYALVLQGGSIDAFNGTRAGYLALGAILLALLTGAVKEFINLSSIQTLYAARLTRAYLGASNRRRFTDHESRSVTDTHRFDNIESAVYYDERVLMPVHLVNITVNDTVSKTSQLVQRDRKGLPLAVGPYSVSVGNDFYQCNFDGSRCQEAASTQKTLEAEPLTIGQWCATSGAAFTTGLGQGTSLGKSIVLVLANVRLGLWWDTRRFSPARLWFFAQRYLLSEMRASFRGAQKAFWYLSDGGHFENTAVYELIRRRLGFIVMSDNGCDPTYQFEDLGNLIRKARIDFGAEIMLATHADMEKLPEKLRPYFGLPHEFANRDIQVRKCALLCRIRYVDGSTGTLVILKPRVFCDVPEDVAHYRSVHGDFPQETTMDQFFDEAQWESYRSLGFRIGERVFARADAGYEWQPADLKKLPD